MHDKHDDRTGMEPELSSGLSGHEPVLGGQFREWPSVMAHLLADQYDALRAGDKLRLWTIRHLRSQIWFAAHERLKAPNTLTGSVYFSRWRAQPEEGERPEYDKIKDEVALRVMHEEVEAMRASLEDVDLRAYPDFVRDREAAIAVVEEYIERWEQ